MFDWKTISEPGAVLTVRTCPIPERFQKRIERAIDGPADDDDDDSDDDSDHTPRS